MRARKNEQIGTLNERILLQEPVYSQTQSGQSITNWRDVQEVYATASFERFMSTESEEAEAEKADE